ncbi:MAG: hypothetical protein Q8O66_03790 [bacterium]|nr:hypothetical protein [bacterium]
MILTGTIVAITELVQMILTILFKLSSVIFEAIYNSPDLNQPITTGGGVIAVTVIHGWAIVRDFANMFIVLGFVVIGIATILRIREYEAQKKLLPLIIVALLINFSLLICGIVIDAANITMGYFMGPTGLATITTNYSNYIWNAKMASLIKASTLGIVSSIPFIGEWINLFSGMFKNYITYNLATAIFTAMAAMILFIYGILFLFRYVALMCLVILSPLAFICSVFPATKQIYDKWKTQFFQWAIIGIPAAFFLYLGGGLLASLMATPAGLAGITTDGSNIVFWIPTVFLLFAYTLIFQTSAIGASAAIGLATGAMGYAWGATKWTGGKALKGGKALGGAGARAMGSEARVQQLGSNWGKFKEKLFLSPTGTQGAKDADRIEKESKIMTNAYGIAKSSGDTTTISRIKNWAKNEKGSKGIAAFRAVSEAGDLHDVYKNPATGRTDFAAVNARLNYAESIGAKNIRKDTVKTMPILEEHNVPLVNKILSQHPTWTPAQAQHEAVVMATSKVPEENLDRDLADSLNHRHIRDAGVRMTDKKREAWKRNALESIKQERRALAPNRTARLALSPSQLATWTELARKERELRRL